MFLYAPTHEFPFFQSKTKTTLLSAIFIFTNEMPKIIFKTHDHGFAAMAMYYTNTNIVFAGDIGNYYYGQGHPMKPQRVRMAHNLLLNYGLYRKMEIYVSRIVTYILNQQNSI